MFLPVPDRSGGASADPGSAAETASASPADPIFGGQLWLAPLTRGGHQAFRRLCVEFGAQVTVGEMCVVRRLLRRDAKEFALLRGYPDEPFFGVQLADRQPESLAEGARIAEGKGCRFLDLNCGCPTHEITGRGLGASLLKKPGRLGRLVEAMRKAVSIPVTVKLRSGWSAARPNVSELARVCEEAGAAAVVIHGRSREQRYTHAADWELVGRVAAERRIPVVGNGDILTHYEARDRQDQARVAAVMIGRGALIKPWIFQEIRTGRAWDPAAEERVRLIYHFVELLRERFGTDERGARRCQDFLAWHLDFFSRYRPLPEARFGAMAREHPLIQTRLSPDDNLEPLETLLRDPRPEVHTRLSDMFVLADGAEEALEQAFRLARENSPPSPSENGDRSRPRGEREWTG